MAVATRAALVSENELQNSPATIGSRRIIVDFTDMIGHLSANGELSGIPRVVFEFANAAAKLASERDATILFAFFDQSSRRYLELSRTSATDHPGCTLDWLLSDPRLRRGYPRPIDKDRLRRKYANQPVRRYWHLAYAHLRLAYRRLAHLVSSASALRPEHTAIEFQGGDTMLMLGSSWCSIPAVEYIEPFHKRGIVSAVILLHDLIPVLDEIEPRPSTNSVPTSVPAALFRPWLDKVIGMRCHFLAVSRATKVDFLKYCQQVQVDAPSVRVVALPHELTVSKVCAVAQEITLVANTNYALFVGPVSGRKNAIRLLEAWAMVLARLGPERTPTLVITSRQGADDVYQTHIQPIKSHVLLLNRPNDFELSILYRQAAFTIFPSLYEGWGLPVGESLWHGTPCITSATSSLAEVGGSFCDYVDPTSVDSIAQVVERFAQDRNYRDNRAKAINRAMLRTWNEFAQDVIDATL